MKQIKCTVFIRPNGKKTESVINNISQEDADYINQNNIKVSMEDIGTDYCVWLDDGLKNEDDDPDEIIVLAQGRSCEATMAEGVQLLKQRKLELDKVRK